MNLQVFNGLSKDLQKILIDSAIELENEFADIYESKIRGPAREEMKKAGMEFVKFSPEESKKYYELYKTSTWEAEAKRNPDVVNKLKELITKK